jgi:carotene biosynthesis associated membrane protein
VLHTPSALPRTAVAAWVPVGAAVLVQIVYPLVPADERTPVTLLSVAVFALASLVDVGRRHGRRGVGLLLLVAGGGGLLAEAVGVRTGFPFGEYAYTGTLGPQLLGVPLVVPLAWTMMAWPALVVGRTLARGAAATALVGGAALAAWDLFLDPQMVAAGHWTWADPEPALPLVPGIPLTNYAGWVLVSVLMVGALHHLLPRDPRPSGPASALYLWTYGSSVLAHAAFFGLPGSALVGGIVMGLVAVPFARRLVRDARGVPVDRG